MIVGALGLDVTVKVTALLVTPPTVTIRLPVVAPLGTGATIFEALQLVGAAAVPLNFTVLEPCVSPKFVPVIVTGAPIEPEVGLKLVILGPAVPVGAAALTAMRTAPQLSEDASDALAEAEPAVGWMRCSEMSLVLGSAGTKSVRA